MIDDNKFSSKLIVIDLEETILILDKYSHGLELIEFVNTFSKRYDWGEILLKYDSNGGIDKFEITISESNELSKVSSREPATSILEKLVLIEDYTSPKNIIFIDNNINDILSKKIFYDILLPNLIFVNGDYSNTNLLNNESKINNIKSYIKSNFKITEFEIEDIINRYINFISWDTHSGFTINPADDSGFKRAINSYFIDNSTEWISYNITNNYNQILYGVATFRDIIKNKSNVEYVTNIDTLDSITPKFNLKYNESDYLFKKIIPKYSFGHNFLKYINENFIQPHTNDSVNYLKDFKIHECNTIHLDTTINLNHTYNDMLVGNIVMVPIDNNIVITTTKVGSTWAVSTFSKHNNNSHVFGSSRNVFDFNINTSNTKIYCHGLDNPDTLDDVTKLTIKTYDDIINKKVSNKIYILYRNPLTRYIQCVQEDVIRFLKVTYEESGNSGLISLYSKLTSGYLYYDKILHTLKKLNSTNLQLSNLKEISQIYSNDLDVMEFISVLINKILHFFYYPDSIYDDIDNSVRIPEFTFDKLKTHAWWPYSTLTQHDTLYLTYVWELYVNLNKSDNIEFLNIDVENINDIIVKNNTSTHSLDGIVKNDTPKKFKNIFQNSVYEYINNDFNIYRSIKRNLSSEFIAYNKIKNINK
jgi:hypothetical protein